MKQIDYAHTHWLIHQSVSVVAWVNKMTIQVRRTGDLVWHMWKYIEVAVCLYYWI